MLELSADISQIVQLLSTEELVNHVKINVFTQGSGLGPILLLVMANFIQKELENLGYLLYAFADNFSFIFSFRRWLDVELEAYSLLEIFC